MSSSSPVMGFTTQPAERNRIKVPNYSAILTFQFFLLYTAVNAIGQKKIRFPLAFEESGGENMK
jgi:hypothetical protein